jgi:heat shock protein HtpX
MAAGLATYQWNNQIKSLLLLAGFPLLPLLMLGAGCAAWDYWALPQIAPFTHAPAPTPEHALRAAEAGIVSYGPGVVAAVLVWFAIAFLFQARLMRLAAHSQPVTREQMPRIYNMLENLCIERGLVMPQFEVIDSPALNAFATGISDKTYRIVLTRGLIEHLPDDELEAVIGHELTHIINRDARLLVIAVVFVGMISFCCQLLARMLMHGWRPNYYVSRNDRDSGGAALLAMLVSLAILAVGYFFAIVIRFALSRKREFLADAGSVELTKNPEAMMKALERISGNDTVTGMPNEVQQMCIENTHSFLGIFATHPPINKRIAAISEMTRTPVPSLPVSLGRMPEEPWTGGVAPMHPNPGVYSGSGPRPWGNPPGTTGTPPGTPTVGPWTKS